MIVDDDTATCEVCSTRMPIDNMEHMGEGIMYCPGCASKAEAAFRKCTHEWRPDMDQWGDPAHYCSRCGFVVSDDDFPDAVGYPAPPRVTHETQDQK